MEPFVEVASALSRARVRYVLIGVAGANYYAASGSTIFTTQDHDLFLPNEPRNALRALRVLRSRRFQLWCGDVLLGEPLDAFLAQRVVERRALVHASNGRGLDIDLTFVMAGFAFGDVWKARRVFRADRVRLPVASLAHIVRSKAAAGRPKDRLFLATHEEALRQLLARERG